MKSWQMQEAKAKMSELVKCAQDQPQDITVHGKSVAIVISPETFQRLSQTQESFVDFMRRSPFWGTDELRLERDTSLNREITF